MSADKKDKLGQRREAFGLNWAGKADCIRALQEPSKAALKACPDRSLDFENTQNLFIEGDNMEALKLLQNAYRGKVKMIYIDPPYNTGKEFIYPDNYKEGLDSYLEYTGQKNKTGKTTTDVEKSGRFHSRWLSMMYPRLHLAHNLLREDGVFVAHIDEHELHHLQLILSDIFGPENYLGPIVWDKKNPKGDAKGIATQHESILIYAKSKEHFLKNCKLTKPKANAEKMLKKAKVLFSKLGQRVLPQDLQHTIKKYNLNIDATTCLQTSTLETINAEYQQWLKDRRITGGEAGYKYIDDKGQVYARVPMTWPSKKVAPPDYYKVLVHPKTHKPCPVPDRGWRYPSESLQKLLDDKQIIFGPDHTTQPMRKYLLKNHLTENISSILSFGGSDDALMQEFDIHFDNPKPVQLACLMLEYFLGSSKKPIVMDFFAGSATLAHATLLYNQKLHTSNRARYICIQLPEKTKASSQAYKKGYTNIAQMAQARIHKAVKKIKYEFDTAAATDRNRPKFDTMGLDTTNTGTTKKGAIDLGSIDLGVKVFRLSPSCFKHWDENQAPQDAKQLAGVVVEHMDYIDPCASRQDLLYEIMIKNGVPLDEPIKELTSHTYTFKQGRLLVCVKAELSYDCIMQISHLKPTPEKVIFLDASFKGDDELKVNALHIFKTRASHREQSIDFCIV